MVWDFREGEREGEGDKSSLTEGDRMCERDLYINTEREREIELWRGMERVIVLLLYSII